MRRLPVAHTLLRAVSILVSTLIQPSFPKLRKKCSLYPMSVDTFTSVVIFTLDFEARRQLDPINEYFTALRATLILVAENQNVTLSLPRELLRRIKRLAADRDTSVSSLMTEALTRLANETRRYSAARSRSLAALRSAGSLGTLGRRKWSRDELHER